MTEINLRTAQAADAPVILDLIKALAVYEKGADQVHCTVADILRDGFGPSPVFQCLLAEIDGRPAGFALYFFKWSTWTGTCCLHLEDLFVPPEFRKRGVGQGLLKALARVAVARGCRRFEWEVLDWNHLARDFYHGLGAFHKQGWLPYRMEGEALEQFARGGSA